MANRHAPYHPIVFVRGYAGTAADVEDAAADPYMGFNAGSTRTRRAWDGSLQRHYFESPLVRLRDERVCSTVDGARVPSTRGYDDAYVDGEDVTAPHPSDPARPLRDDVTLPYRSVVVFRYHDEASAAFGSGVRQPIEHHARALGELILRLRTLACRAGGRDPVRGTALDNGIAPDDFRVHLVAHSMGGLVCRAFLQNPALGRADARRLVDRVFTYATPHNGIDLRLLRNVPGWSVLGDAANFNRARMAAYLGLPRGTTDVADLGAFPPERVFNLVGTNPADYRVLNGLAAWAAGEASDGLVRTAHATTHGRDGDGRPVRSPRACVHRSHSGHHGILNSEEGYQNLVRFLFGTVRVDGVLDVDAVTLPAPLQARKDAGAQVRASYRFEVVATVRGARWDLHRRTLRENSAIHRSYDELFPLRAGRRVPDRGASPHLFSLFLDPARSVDPAAGSIAFAFDLAVPVPDYAVDGRPWLERHYEGAALFRDRLVVEARPSSGTPGGWRLRHGWQAAGAPDAMDDATTAALPGGGLGLAVPVRSPGGDPGLRAALRIELRPRD